MDRIVLVTKPTRLEELVRKYHSEGAARFVLESEGQSVDKEFREHAQYEAALAEVRRQIPADVPVTIVGREDLPHLGVLLRRNDLVVVVGPDGLFANTAQYVGEQPLLTVNPYPGRSSNMLWQPGDVRRGITLAAGGSAKLEKLPFAKAQIGKRVLWGINDVFIGRKDRVSAWYGISYRAGQADERLDDPEDDFDDLDDFEEEEGEHDAVSEPDVAQTEQSEDQFSDGILISTGVGCTGGWMRSVATMVGGLIEPGGRHRLQVLPMPTSNELVFVVFNPGMGATLITGHIRPGVELAAVSQMPKGGYVFSDGIVEKALEWGAGERVTVSVGERHVTRIVP